MSVKESELIPKESTFSSLPLSGSVTLQAIPLLLLDLFQFKTASAFEAKSVTNGKRNEFHFKEEEKKHLPRIPNQLERTPTRTQMAKTFGVLNTEIKFQARGAARQGNEEIPAKRRRSCQREIHGSVWSVRCL